MTQGKTKFEKTMATKKPEIEGLTATDNAANLADLFNQKDVRTGEVPSANCHGTARGMAELASIMANKGQRYSKGAENDSTHSVLMTQDTWSKMHDGEKLATDAVLPGGRYNVTHTHTHTQFVIYCEALKLFSNNCVNYHFRNANELHPGRCIRI